MIPLAGSVQRNGRGSLRGQLTLAPDWDSDAVNESIAAGFGIGETVPVFYDPKDRAKVEVDEDGLKAASEERVSALQASAARLESEMRARGDTPPAR